MLILIGLLLLAAAGFLGAALAIGPVTWAWASITASALAAVALAVRWWRSRRARRAAAHRRRRAGGGGTGAASPDPKPSASGGRYRAARQAGEPAEEDTDAVDLLVVSELTDEVLVVDERPRYHSSGCRWLGSRPTEALPVQEARDLGFTPCAGCGPDAELARRHRATSAG
ncbi:MAG: hypothetical protein GEV09_09785 [Pseudonocardiaceae bacterium]|nr:hypothetical protein [Pseudonocardiaceae bacterium]